ncbi:MAG: GDP-mannose 4,6-dehydratase [Patescibacteria group bacterium]
MAVIKTSLVAGGAGFIGSNLCEYLIKKGRNVICVDNLFTGNRENIRNLLVKDNFLFINHDVVNPLFLDEMLIDEVYNLTCSGAAVHFQYNAIRTLKINTIGTMNLLGLAKKHKAKFLQVSSAGVYGDPLENPQPETYNGNVNPIGPRACYTEGKRVAETFCYEYNQKYGIDTKIVRLFDTYGPGLNINDGRVIPTFIVQALTGMDITIQGDGKQTRSYSYVTDIVEALYKLMERSGVNVPINVGGETEIEILELAKLIKKLTKSKSKITYEPVFSQDSYRRNPDITRAREILKWKPTTSLEAGLKHTIADLKKELSNNLI